MKEDWRKQDKALYLPGKKPELVEVPTMRFITVQGKGDPNGPAFQACMDKLYALTWTIRMMPKSGIVPEGYYEYTVFPLEGVWDAVGEWDATQPLNKDALLYTVMIRQPAFVTSDVFEMAADMVRKKKKLDLEGAALEDLTEGLCVQMMHMGLYDDEPASFAQMDAFLGENGLSRIGHVHREIYLSDPRKGKPENRRTVLRYQVRQN